MEAKGVDFIYSYYNWRPAGDVNERKVRKRQSEGHLKGTFRSARDYAFGNIPNIVKTLHVDKAY